MTLGGFCTETTGLQSSVTSFSVAFFFFFLVRPRLDGLFQQTIDLTIQDFLIGLVKTLFEWQT